MSIVGKRSPISETAELLFVNPNGKTLQVGKKTGLWPLQFVKDARYFTRSCSDKGVMRSLIVLTLYYNCRPINDGNDEIIAQISQHLTQLWERIIIVSRFNALVNGFCATL